MKKIHPLLLFLFLSVNLFGLGILYLKVTKKLSIYIHPSSQWFVLLSALILLFLGTQLISTKNFSHAERSVRIGIFLLFTTALLILFIKPTPLSVETARIRISDSSNVPNQKNFTTRKTSEFTLVDWLAAFTHPEEALRYENVPAHLSGFLLIQDNQPMVGRLVITCCGADAQPALIPFSWSGDLPKENTWIDIKGTMHSKDGKPYLKANELSIIPEPENPYAE
jgi:uncharacterized repeat protein (TIGR03943 family)